MNIHPILVHFPIALLVFYALIELLPIARLFPKVSWKPICEFLLYAGTLMLYPTLLAGLIAEDIVGEKNYAVIPYHKTSAIITLIIFSIAAALALWNHYRPINNQNLFRIKEKLLALLGVIALLVTGALGGAIVYGYNNDPFTSLLTGLLGLK